MPDGVPVEIISPGRSVITWDTSQTRWGTETSGCHAEAAFDAHGPLPWAAPEGGPSFPA
jgi:hypothetical protein